MSKSKFLFVTRAREPFFDLAKSLMKPIHKVLDIGAGDGAFASFCNRPDMYMIDSNADSVAYFKTKFPNYQHATLPQLPYQNDFFDIIHCSHVIEHLQPQELYDTLVEMDRCLKPDGYIVISTPLMTDQFYDDLSHTKPYHPSIFYRYMTDVKNKNLSRAKISNKYAVIDLVFRYDATKIIIYSSQDTKLWYYHFMSKFVSILFKFGLKRYIKSGYTIILQKSV